MALEAKAGDTTVIGRLKNPRRNLPDCVHVIRTGSQATANFLGGEHGWIVMWFSRGREAQNTWAGWISGECSVLQQKGWGGSLAVL